MEKLSGLSQKLDAVSESVERCHSLVRNAQPPVKLVEERDSRSNSPTKSVLVRQITNLSSQLEQVDDQILDATSLNNLFVQSL